MLLGAEGGEGSAVEGIECWGADSDLARQALGARLRQGLSCFLS